ncbi:MAG TPA: DegT/DnrJ/EryC1/StrS family aminotransferase [Candidatus Eisenbacteria bacterium]|nr:DegT/DnrJ/EryC1/StrS family aminotransferase [Candidatus Eisenbacteria bacterium]
MKPIPFVDLGRQHKMLKDTIAKAMNRVIDSSDFIAGKELEKFEKNFATFCHKRYAVGVNSGTDGLKLALLAYGIGKGDEVITTANSYFSSAMVITEIGATAVLVDVYPDTHAMNVDQLEHAITQKTKAIIPVHMYGQPADMEEIAKIAQQHNLFIIEDACQAHGAVYKGKLIPYTETGVFSFYPGKNLGSFGDGGIVVTNNNSVANKIRILRNDGSRKKYIHDTIGIKSRLDTLQAAVLNVKLPYLSRWNEKRRLNAALYSSYLQDVPGLVLPTEKEDRTHVYHLYVIETPKRNALQKYLDSHGIRTGIHYPIPIHLQKAYASKGYKKGDFPVSEKKAQRILSLPMFPELTKKEIRSISNVVRDFFKKSL